MTRFQLGVIECADWKVGGWQGVALERMEGGRVGRKNDCI